MVLIDKKINTNFWVRIKLIQLSSSCKFILHQLSTPLEMKLYSSLYIKTEHTILHENEKSSTLNCRILKKSSKNRRQKEWKQIHNFTPPTPFWKCLKPSSKSGRKGWIGCWWCGGCWLDTIEIKSNIIEFGIGWTSCWNEGLLKTFDSR